MWERHLLVPPNLRLKAKRVTNRSIPRPTKPHEWWGIDMTKVVVEGFGWVYMVVVLDWYTKKKNDCGSRNGPVPLCCSLHSMPRSQIITHITCTQPAAISHPGSFNENTTIVIGLRSSLLDKWGALHLPAAKKRNATSIIIIKWIC
jgi:hypothetical protein